MSLWESDFPVEDYGPWDEMVQFSYALRGFSSPPQSIFGASEPIIHEDNIDARDVHNNPVDLSWPSLPVLAKSDGEAHQETEENFDATDINIDNTIITSPLPGPVDHTEGKNMLMVLPPLDTTVAAVNVDDDIDNNVTSPPPGPVDHTVAAVIVDDNIDNYITSPPSGPVDHTEVNMSMMLPPLDTAVAAVTVVDDNPSGIAHDYTEEYSAMMRTMMMIREAKRQHGPSMDDHHTSPHEFTDYSSSGTIDLHGTNYPPGFRFRPTDQELLIHYLGNKVSGLNPMPDHPMPEVDLYAHSPDELTRDHPLISYATEWYFFSKRDKKDNNPNQNQPNRSTNDGYWESIGAIKAVKSNKDRRTVGYMRVLDYFYRKPNSKKVRSDWKMMEYMLTRDDDDPVDKTTTKLEKWVLCKIYENKRSTGQKRKHQQLIDD